jgi:hypothetical protein
MSSLAKYLLKQGGAGASKLGELVTKHPKASALSSLLGGGAAGYAMGDEGEDEEMEDGDAPVSPEQINELLQEINERQTRHLGYGR